jgi:bla regulator protein blaR1
MIWKLPALWDAHLPGLANHLWQSTLVVLVAGLLTLGLRKHQARARYWLWFAASMKFLVPFSLLVSLGSHLALPRASAPTRPTLYFVIAEISQPFAVRTAPTAASVRPIVPPHLPRLPVVFPILAIVWLMGSVFLLCVWILRWRRISAAIKKSVPVSDGREVVTLRRMKRIGGVRCPIDVLLSETSLEPGIFGITKPALIWPEAISKRLEDAHLEAILAHEVWHVRRRDNLSAAWHMLVEAVFWFYPLVWWLGARLIEERERACDEEVVAWGIERHIYAESILKVCEFCLGSPLVCVSGVTGADLKKRMVHIMSDRILHKLDFARKLLLGSAAVLAIAAPIVVGLFHATPGQAQSEPAVTPQSFESVLIRPDSSTPNGFFHTKLMFSLMDGSFSARGVTLEALIRLAYHVQDSQISGGPDWLNTQKFAIDAKLNSAAAEQLRKQPPNPKNVNDQAALRTLLTEKFKLAVHPETRNLPVYDLVVAEDGPKLQESKGPHMVRVERGELNSPGMPMSLLVDDLSRRLGQTVVDKTGLKGEYAFTLHWTPDATEDERFKLQAGPQAPAETMPDASGPPLMTAIQEQLGLKLEPHTEAVQVLVVDHAESPTEN